MSAVNFNKELFEQFKEKYNEALKEDKKTFVFEGEEYVTTYAYWVIQYLSGLFESD